MGHDFFIFSKMQYDNIVSICRSDFWKQAKLNSFIHQFIQTMKWMRGLNVCHNGKCLNNVLISAPSFGQMTLCWDVSSLVISWNHMLIKQCGPKNICISCSPWELLKSFYTEKKKEVLWLRVGFIASYESLMKRMKGGRRRVKKRVQEEMMKKRDER